MDFKEEQASFLVIRVSGQLGGSARMVVNRTSRSCVVRRRWSGKAPRPARDQPAPRLNGEARLDAEALPRRGYPTGGGTPPFGKMVLSCNTHLAIVR